MSGTRSAVEDISPHLTPEEADAIKKRLLAAKNGGIFTPIGVTDTVWVPASNGGVIFSGTAADPRAGFVYLVAHENPGIVRLVRPGENAGRGARGPACRRSTAVSAAVSGLPRPGAARHRQGGAARLRDRRPREQHRRRRAAIRRGGDSVRDGDREGADAAVPAYRQRGRGESRRVSGFGRRRGRGAGPLAGPGRGRRAAWDRARRRS